MVKKSLVITSLLAFFAASSFAAPPAKAEPVATPSAADVSKSKEERGVHAHKKNKKSKAYSDERLSDSSTTAKP